MAKKVRVRSPELVDSRKRKIALFKQNNPDFTYKQLAEKFGCSFHQARGAVKAYEAGKLEYQKKSKSTKEKPVETVESKNDADRIDRMENIADNLISYLEQADLSVDEKIQQISKLTQTMQALQKMQLQSHLKEVDANVITNIIRRYDPSITNDEVIKIYLEERDKL